MYDSEPPNRSPPTSLSRRRFLAAAGAAGLTGVLSGCTDGSGAGLSGGRVPTDVSSWPPEPDGSTLVLQNWYEDWVEWADREFSLGDGSGDVELKNYRHPLQWEARERSPGLLRRIQNRVDEFLRGSDVPERGPTERIDVVSTHWAMVHRAVRNDRLHELPVDRMPAWENVPAAAREVDFYRSEGGGAYAVPAELDLFPLVYDTEAFDSPPDSWDVLWDEAYEGQIVLSTSADQTCRIAALHAGQDPNDPDDLDEIRELLERQRSLLTASPHEIDLVDAIDAFADGDAVVGVFRGPDSLYDPRFVRGLPIDYTVPDEGAMFEGYFHAVPKAAPHPMTALRFLDWSLTPEPAAKLFETERVSPPADVGEQVSRHVREFFTWSDDWTLVPDTMLDVSDYYELTQEVYADS